MQVLVDAMPAPGSFHPTTPFHMVWIATNACNARCLHCSSNSTRRTPDELNTGEACDLMSQFARVGVVDVAVSGGEPLLRRDVVEVIGHARSLGLSVGIGSNGGRLTNAQASALATAGVNRFQVSLDGLRSAHDTLRRWSGLFERALRAIVRADAAGLRVHVCCTITTLNVHELEPFAAFVATLPVARINFSRYVPTGRGTDSLDLSDSEWRSVIERCASLRVEYDGTLEITTHLAQQILVDPSIAGMPAFIGCQAGIGQGCVSANGTVFPCVLLPIPLGNVRDAPFDEIWRTSPVIARLQARDALGGRCGQCPLIGRCGGCRAVAYARTGDYLAADPRCWHEPSHEIASVVTEEGRVNRIHVYPERRGLRKGTHDGSRAEI